MRSEATSTVILEKYSDVAPHLDDVIQAANRERSALGFLPASVFREHAHRGNLFIAARVADGGTLSYAGHLLFDARHSRATVLQIHAIPDARRSGVARHLLDHLKAHLTELGFTSIYAKVADDLLTANAFWERNDFYVQSTKPGGITRGRTILIRAHELHTPQLFERSGITSHNPFGLDSIAQPERPVYLLDLNVLFDLGPRRPRHDATLDVFHAERHGTCQLALSAELQSELRRHLAATKQTDPMHAWAAIFITFQVPPAEEADRLSQKLGAMIFPGSAVDETYSPNERSDLSHLATAIHHRLSGFITSDGAILAAAKQLQAQYAIHVVSPAAFRPSDELAMDDDFVEGSSDGGELTASAPPAATEQELVTMLRHLGVPQAEAVSLWGALDSSERTVQRSAVFSANRIAGYLAVVRQAERSTVRGRLAVDESHPESRQAARLLFAKLIARARGTSPALICLHLAPKQVVVREVAAALGFAGSDDGATLSKLVLNRLVTPSNWSNTARELDSLARLKLPSICPVFKNVDQQIEVLCPDGNRRYVRLHDIESNLSPALFCLPGREAVITPIQAGFAEHLLEHSPQRSLLPRAHATQYSERHYFSDKKTLRHFQRGTVMLFYESGKGGGSSAIVALARVQQAFLKPKKAIDRGDFDPSVLTPDTLSMIGRSQLKTVTSFDNLMLMPRPIPLTRLQALGCGKPHQLITPRVRIVVAPIEIPTRGRR